MANLDDKKEVVKEIKEKVEKSISLVLLKYAGMNAESETALRKHLYENKIDYKIYKNNLVRLALKGTKYEALDDELVGPVAYAFSYEDPTAAARSIYEKIKDIEAVELKAGVVEGTKYDQSGIKEIAQIPGKEILLGRLLGSFNGPISSFARCIKQVAEKKEA